LTTLGLGGPARFFVDVADAAQAKSALTWAKERRLPVFILGGGSNLVVADEGFAGLVLRVGTRGHRWYEDQGEIRVEAQAGEPWDHLVAEAAARGAAGIECLSGIPGTVGAAPVQNIGAYGQEIASTVRRVRVLDRDTLASTDLDADACRFGYRDSAFRRAPERFVILSLTLGLARSGAPTVRYAELAAAVGADPTLASVRHAILGLRRKKSMLLDDGDPNGRSAGSFFTNPVVTAGHAEELAARAVSLGVAGAPSEMPRFALGDGRVKLAAAWLIERAGIARGFRMGPVGVSSQHALALVHHGGAKTDDLVRLACHVHDTVLGRFGIALQPEPIFLGMRWPR
jgi:UDP-N-acetylmuramate dehydrogenase